MAVPAVPGLQKGTVISAEDGGDIHCSKLKHVTQTSIIAEKWETDGQTHRQTDSQGKKHIALTLPTRKARPKTELWMRVWTMIFRRVRLLASRFLVVCHFWSFRGLSSLDLTRVTIIQEKGIMANTVLSHLKFQKTSWYPPVSCAKFVWRTCNLGLIWWIFFTWKWLENNGTH